METSEIPETGNERILLVDDDNVITQMQSQILQRLGYRIESRVSSLEALEAFRADPGGFDLVLTDMTMPHMTGVQLARELFSIRSDIPVIICTGFSGRIDPPTAEAMGIKGLLMKPVVTSEMARMIRQVLNDA